MSDLLVVGEDITTSQQDVYEQGDQIVGGDQLLDELLLRGSTAADLGRIRFNSPLEIDEVSAGDTTAFRYRPVVTRSTAYIGGMIIASPDWTIDPGAGTFIPTLLGDNSLFRQNVAPAFAAYTFSNVLAVWQNAGNFNLPGMLCFNIGIVHARTTSGTSTASNAVGMNFSPQVRATVNGAIMNRTDTNALRVSPTHSTVAGSTVSYGTVRGMHCLAPAVALFQPQAGTENMTAYYGIDFSNMTFGGASATYSVVRSLLNAGTNKRFLDHTGTAQSRMRGSLFFDVDNVGVFYGASNDVVTYWNSANAAYRTQFVANTTSLLMSNPASGRILFDNTIAVTAGAEFNFNCGKFSLGAQTGAVGNQVGVFVAGTRSTGLAGEWSDFLLTQAANLTVDHAMGGVFGWTVNAPSMTIGTGTVTTAGALNVGGNVNQGSVNRFGIRCISNPSGGSGVNAALWITVGNTQLDGDLTHTGTNVGFFGATPVPQSAAYTRNATIVEDRTLLASASATTLNNNNVLAALIADLQALGILG